MPEPRSPRPAPRRRPGRPRGATDATVYDRVCAGLRARVACGAWPAGTMLPGRKALAAAYHVGTATVDRAVAALVRDGTLRAEAGRGTFVAHAPLPAVVGAPARIGIVLELLESQREEGFLWNWIVLRAIEAELSRTGAEGVVLDRGAAPFSPESAVDRLIEARADACILLDFRETREAIAAACRKAAQAGRPAVCVSQNPVPAPAIAIAYDNRAAGRLAALHLLDRGYRELVFLGIYGNDWEKERLAAARTVVRKRRGARLILRAATKRPESGGPDCARLERTRARDLARKTLAAGLPPQAGVIAANDLVAEVFAEEAQRAGLPPGEAFALVGFDDRAMASALGLTSLRPPLEAMGTEAARQALALVAGSATPNRLLLGPELITRRSTAGLNP